MTLNSLHLKTILNVTENAIGNPLQLFFLVPVSNIKCNHLGTCWFSTGGLS